MLNRRTILLGLLSCPVCASLAHAADGPHWSYEGTEGPAQWGNLDPSFKACAVGTAQSPIDLKDAVKTDFGRVILDWKPQAYALVNNGHTIQANAKRQRRQRDLRAATIPLSCAERTRRQRRAHGDGGAFRSRET